MDADSLRQIVRVMGDNKASEHVAKLLRVCRRHPGDYKKIQSKVKKYVKADCFDRVYPLVLALKGVEEAINTQNASEALSAQRRSEDQSNKDDYKALK